jgi:putative hydrolase of the HAD superfamily
MGLDLSGVRAFLLDVGGVLLVPEAARLAPVLHAHGGTTEESAIIRAHFAAMTAADDGTAFDWKIYQRQLLTGCGVAASRIDAGLAAYADAFGAINLWQQPIAGAAQALADLHRTGVALAIVSNSDGTVQASLAATGICQTGPGPGTPIEVILDSQVVGSEKPDPGIFRIALERLGVDAADAVHVGDTRFADVAGARAAGIRVLHIDPYDECPAPSGHEHARDLAEIAAAYSPWL